MATKATIPHHNYYSGYYFDNRSWRGYREKQYCSLLEGTWVSSHSQERACRLMKYELHDLGSPMGGTFATEGT